MSDEEINKLVICGVMIPVWILVGLIYLFWK